jgi:membrane protease YdiL (CAAX protease family)
MTIAMEEGTKTPNRAEQTRQNQFLVLLVVALPIVANWLRNESLVLWGMLLFLPWAVRRNRLRTTHLIVILLASYLIPTFFWSAPSFLVEKGSGIVVYLYLALLIAPLRQSLDWLRPGRLSWWTVMLAIAVAALSAAGLIAWVYFANPPMHYYARILPDVSPWRLAIYMAGFALVNSLIEEIIWRGVMMSALDAAFGAGLFSLLLQSISFGLAHFRGGFPSGWMGAFLAGLFGLAMGLLRRRTNGLLTSWCVHVVADLTVIGLIVHFAPAG